MKESRFLIIPKSNNFRDIINVKEITNELKKKGHDCITLTSQISDKNLEFIELINSIVEKLYLLRMQTH